MNQVWDIFSLSYTKKVENLIHLGVKLIVSLSSMSVLTLTVWAGFYNVTGVSAIIDLQKTTFLRYLAWQMFSENYY